MIVPIDTFFKGVTEGFFYASASATLSYLTRKRFQELGSYFASLSHALFLTRFAARVWQDLSPKKYRSVQHTIDTFFIRYPSLDFYLRTTLISTAFFKDFRTTSTYILGSWTGLTLSWKKKVAKMEHLLYAFS